MTLFSPIALLLLIPWGIAAMWAFRRNAQIASVPFIGLWDRNRSDNTQSGHRRIPPMWLVLILVATFLAVLSSAGIAVRSTQATVTLIVDCRLSMSPPARIESALKQLHLPNGQRVRVIPVPGIAYTCRLEDIATQLYFTADPDDAPLRYALLTALKSDSSAVYLISDRSTPVQDERIVSVTPPTPLNNAGIDRFAITDASRAQALVRVYNGSSLRTATLRVDEISRPIDLPVRGSAQDYFIDLPHVNDVAEAHLEIDDDIVADNLAFLVRGQAWPRIEIEGNVSAALRRMVGVYTRHRPVSDRSPSVRIASTPTAADDLTIVVTGAGSSESLDDGPLSIDTDSPLSRDVDWSSVTAQAHAGASPGDGWHPIVRRGSRTLVATRDAPPAVWVAIDDLEWSKRPDYVVFWTNVFDWIGGGNPTFSSTFFPMTVDQSLPVTQSDSTVIGSPGVYHAADGQNIATAILAVRSTAMKTSARRTITPVSTEVFTSINRWLLLGSLALCAVALGLRRA